MPAPVFGKGYAWAHAHPLRRPRTAAAARSPAAPAADRLTAAWAARGRAARSSCAKAVVWRRRAWERLASSRLSSAQLSWRLSSRPASSSGQLFSLPCADPALGDGSLRLALTRRRTRLMDCHRPYTCLQRKRAASPRPFLLIAMPSAHLQSGVARVFTSKLIAWVVGTVAIRNACVTSWVSLWQLLPGEITRKSTS